MSWKTIADKIGHTLWGTTERKPDGDDGPAGALVPAN
jgi:hypothetical protein